MRARARSIRWGHSVERILSPLRKFQGDGNAVEKGTIVISEQIRSLPSAGLGDEENVGFTRTWNESLNRRENEAD